MNTIESRSTGSTTALSAAVAAAVAMLTSLALLLGLGGLAQGASQALPAVPTPTSVIQQQPAPDLSKPELSQQLSPKQQEELRALTATPEKRAELAADLAAAFGGIASVGVSGPGEGATGAVAQQVSTTGYEAEDVLAYGATSSHVWITASYADMARGAIWGAVYYCKTRGVPAWLCNHAGNVLTNMASGWGWANNHGVWAALYYYGRFDSGRW